MWWVWNNQPVCHFQSSKKECPEIVFVIKKGEGIEEISQRLKDQGLIKSPLVFKIQVIRQGLVKKIQAGEFYLSSGEKPSKIAFLLTKGTFDKKITIPEGLRSEEIGELLQKRGLEIDLKKWQEEVKKQQIEGYLFPDTYMIPKDANIQQIIKIFLNNFEKKFDNSLKKQALSQGIDEESVLILASLIEREIKSQEDKPIVADILLKRLQKNWPLQVDATVQYGLATQKCKLGADCDWWLKKLTENDLRVDSLYNTYLYRGLPPSPICNPGLSSIEAVLQPQPSPYWFYLTGTDGKTYFAKTAQDHTKNIEEYLK